MALEPGTAVGERYRLIEPLASGGMATVWVGEARGSRKRVAIKFLMKEVAAQEDIRARFSREATAHLDSVHIVKMYEHGVMDDDTPFIVMELLDGEDLGTRLARQGRLPPRMVGTILDEMAAALQVAHAAGIVHRDIKPDNIFLARLDDGREQVKLLDFGIAKHTAIHTHSVVTATGTMMGTPGYMSPEQVLTGSKVDLRSDLWSVGVVAYHALTGDIPFDGATLGALCVAITRGRYLPPTQQVSSLPEALDVWMQRALSVEPADRFESAEELATAFRAAVAGVAPEPSRSPQKRTRHDDHDTVHDAITVIRGRPPGKGSRWWVLALVATGAAALGGLAVAQLLPAERAIEPAAPAAGHSETADDAAADDQQPRQSHPEATTAGSAATSASATSASATSASATSASATSASATSASATSASATSASATSASATSASATSASATSASATSASATSAGSGGAAAGSGHAGPPLGQPKWHPRPPPPAPTPTVKDRGF